jgi:hypothetical protein
MLTSVRVSAAAPHAVAPARSPVQDHPHRSATLAACMADAHRHVRAWASCQWVRHRGKRHAHLGRRPSITTEVKVPAVMG